VQSVDISSCDREPIHIPGAIQPHGLLLIADADSLEVVGGAGALEERLAPDWLGRRLFDLVGQDIAGQLSTLASGVRSRMLEQPVAGRTERFDALIHRGNGHLLLELEPAPPRAAPAMQLLAQIEGFTRAFEQAADIPELCRRACEAVRAITGFDRVMAYRFLDDEAGRVVAEDRNPALQSFLHHHFPGSDIPRQARALYIRNRARAIPDVDYVPAPLRPERFAGVDLSDVALRSVSPIHLQYLRNMGVGASASFSIVRDGTLWGLIACHHRSPHPLPREASVAATALANALAREIAAREQQSAYDRRLRLRNAVDELLADFRGDRPLGVIITDTADRLRRLLDADGFAYSDGEHVQLHGIGPKPDALRALVSWTVEAAGGEPWATHRLGTVHPAADGWPERTSGLLAVPLTQEGRTLFWFRVEQIEEVRWAGDPNKLHQESADVPLSPRRSFETWAETVRGRARRWTTEEIDAARRLARGIDDARFHHRLRLLNGELQATLKERDALLAQQELLMREVDHRVQNSLQMVASYLQLQAREAGPGPLADRLAEAQARLAAVGLVHRKLYRADHPQALDLGDYLGELVGDLRTALGREWAPHVRAQLSAMLMPTDRAVPVGLVMTELVLNASKYAYDGLPGPIEVTLEQHGSRLRLTVADRGKGRNGAAQPEGSGFGSRMVASTVRQLGGMLEESDNGPGLRATLTAPIEG